MSIVPQVVSAFASSIAARSVQVLFTVSQTPSPGVASPTSLSSATVKTLGQVAAVALQTENSDVLPLASVAVAVITSPGLIVKEPDPR